MEGEAPKEGTGQADLSKIIDDLKLENEMALSERDIARKESDAKSAMISDLQSRLNQMSESAASIGERVAGLTAERDQLKEQVEKSDVKALTEERDQLKGRVAELDQMVTPPGISSLEKAIEHVKQNFVPGDKVATIMVTQDGQVFYDDSINSGRVHADDLKLLHFTFRNPSFVPEPPKP